MRFDGPLPLAPMVVALLGGCAAADGSDSGIGGRDSDDIEDAPVPFQELYDQGVDRYLGVFAPATSEALADGIVTHSFSGEAGPICFTGNEYTMSTRDGSRDELMIFLQGGGACGPTSCDPAVDVAPPGIPAPVAQLGLLNASDPDNPTLGYDVGYLPYCDGSLWAGDIDRDTDGDGTDDRFFRGAMNLSAALDVIAETFPSPSRILLTGNSAGGWGTHYALPLVRLHYPGVPIELVNDSGVGISEPGTQQTLVDYWNTSTAYPASCPDCIGDDGHLTGFHSYQLEEDPNLQMGFMSTKRDEVVLATMSVAPEAWEAELLAAVAELEALHPERFRSFIAEGDGHTFVLRDFDREVGGSSPRAWIDALLSGGDWVSVADPE